ncbi:hypothetical protein KP509_25G025000 [Ceratopteris richardii]|uniref:Protein kinase domain-containing protein n=1 Tax=Ceratopteris richardii TaxID=49495 RepID=A0A8T2RNN9_CERRI|nr:hypothetical protein KP509_25G025000 [Ceratopteris richardii]KAH7298045.1 hypothetical protein KP509_25G025000 [Ceratopteris richardii]KAH7298046.1 hypothetical protein KP509_25G025000 [Ceratopteris richardii]KAH7298047.1 hypothetical protein KP509_25G025000 [Ceratopteris richardii]KAH7298048.1 hypothetical protein KP509_25G025000 [Ceratopteris richardii]
MELSSLYKVSPIPCSPWQGIAFRHLKSESTRKLALTKVTNRLIYRGTSLPNRRFWNENKGAHILRCEAAQADTSTLSTEICSEEDIRELKLANEVDEPFNYVGNKFTEDSILSVEASPDFKAISETEPREDNKINCLDLIVEDQVAGFSSSTYGHIEEEKQKGTFWHIVENDLAFMKNGWNSLKKEGLPSLSKTALKLGTLTLWEDHSLVEVTDTQLPQPYSPGLSGLKLAAADALAIKAYFQMALNWTRALNIPLNSSYDPGFIAAYFSRRPHVLLFRVFQILAVFGSAYLHLEFEKLLNTSEWTESNTQKRGAELIKDALISLGPVSIKVGQSLSTRPDLIGMVPAKIFAEMQDNLPPFSTDEAVSVIEEELGAPINMLFSELSEMPVAAASFGQVYKGRTVEGQEVAVKVQRPNVLMSVALDVYILRIGLDVVRKVAKRRSDLKLYADELGQGFFGELDYLQEADNALEFKEAHSKLSFIEVPEVLRQLSTRRVLTMEWINGDRPIDLVQFTELPNPQGNPELSSRQFRTKQRLLTMVNKGVEASLVQLFDSGILHADPHPGNMLYTEDGKMV